MLSKAASIIPVDATLHLELINEKHAPATFLLVQKNREQLREWLPWVDSMQTLENFTAYIDRCQTQHEEGSDYGYVIMLDKKPTGRIGIHYINQQNKLGAIGYWIGTDFSGKGIITKACQALINHCFQNLGLNRIEIKCATGNEKSAAVAERLGFVKEGVLRQAELVNGKFHDLNLYALLKEDWVSR
jgi:ribosomal-protein-serine acetyltransferase